MLGVVIFAEMLVLHIHADPLHQNKDNSLVDVAHRCAPSIRTTPVPANHGKREKQEDESMDLKENTPTYEATLASIWRVGSPWA
jgi:hypothetical protein